MKSEIDRPYVSIPLEDITAAADLIQKAFPGLKAARALVEHTAVSILRRGMLIERTALQSELARTAAHNAELRATLEHIARVEPNGWGCYVRERLAVVDGSRPTPPAPK